MNPKGPIAVFAYAFAHRKTQDFLVELAAAGYQQVTVIGAPWRQLAHSDSTAYFPARLRSVSPLPTDKLCDALGFSYNRHDHNDVDAVAALQAKAGFTFAIISGARILKRAIIELFPEGILNIHPGKLPETAGLDLFYYTIAKNVAPGVTAHFIDTRVDAGEELFFEETPIGPDDDVEALQYNNYQSQLRALRRFLALRESGELAATPVDRPYKNQPMAPDEKRAALERFAGWRAEQHVTQQANALFAACERGDAAGAGEILDRYPALIDARTTKGWTPLIVASFHQHPDVVRILLARHADPNACGHRGTTALMYGKTALLGKEGPDMTVLDMLLAAGADPTRRDAFGHDIFHYLEEAGDQMIAEHLRSFAK